MTARKAAPADVVEVDDVADVLPLLLIRTAKAMLDRLAAAAHKPQTGPTRMTVVHGFAARYIATHDNVTTVELAHHLGVTKQSTSEVVSALEQAGIVQRAPHPDDRRARVLTLTDMGQEKLRDGRKRWLEAEREWEALVGADELATVRAALETYLEAFPPGSHPAVDL